MGLLDLKAKKKRADRGNRPPDGPSTGSKATDSTANTSDASGPPASSPGLSRDTLEEDVSPDLLEAFLERAAIMEYHGNLTRNEAEMAAWKDLFKEAKT